MPFDVFSSADNTRVLGSLTVAADPAGNPGNVNIAGTVTASGSIVAASGLSAASGLTIAAGGLSLSGGLQYDSLIGAMPTNTLSQSIPVAAGSAITMTGSGRIIRVSCSALTTTTALTPTASSLTGTSGFTNGQEVVLYNVAATGSNISISAGAGTPFVLIGQNMATFVYDAFLQVWIHRN